MWYIYPTKFFDIKYSVKDNTNIKDFDNCLFIVNHNDINNYKKFKDPMIMTEEIKKSGKNFNVITNFDLFKYFPIYKGYNCIFKNDGCVKKMTNYLKKGENGVIYLLESHENKGIYYILSEVKVPIVFVKKRFFNNKIEIEYKKVQNYEIGKGPDEFLKFIKENLFN